METEQANNPPAKPGLWRGALRFLLEKILRLYYTARAPGTPRRLKIASVLVLFYLVFPFDLISDLLPLIGVGDDILALSFLGWRLSRHATQETKAQARRKALQIIP